MKTTICVLLAFAITALSALSFGGDDGRCACATDCLSKGFTPADCKELCQ